MFLGCVPMRTFSMVLKKRPRSVKVNKYKLKTKKAMAKRIKIVSTVKLTVADWQA